MSQDTKPRWHAVTRTIAQSDNDEQRSKNVTVPGSLDGAVLLLVKQGDDPVVEYLYGVTRRLNEAGKLAGFKVEPLDDGVEPVLPEDAGSLAHPLVPFHARLNRQSQMREMRTDWTGLRKSVEALMPDDSYVSVRLRARGGMVEDARIRNWVSSEYAGVEDESELVSANTMCARISVGCRREDNAPLLAKRVGQAVFPLLSSMGAHRSRPRFGAFAVAAVLTLLVLAHPLLEHAWRDMLTLPGGVHVSKTLLFGLAGIVVVTLFLLAVSMIPFVTLPRPFVLAASATATIYLLSGFVTLPAWSALIPFTVTVLLAVRWWRWTAWDDIMCRPHRYWAFVSNRNAQDSDNSTKLGVVNKLATVNAYGTQRTTLLIPPSILVPLVTPTGNATALRQDTHPAPEPLTHDGIPVGVDQTQRATYIPLSQLFGGIAIFGAAGRGKSALSHGIMQWATSARSTTDAKVWGSDTRIIDFEMKDADGVRIMNKYRAAHPSGVPAHSIVLADPHTPCIDLIGMRDGLDASSTAVNAAAAMQFSFDDGDIRGASLEVLTHAMTIGVAVQRWLNAYVKTHGAGGAHPIIDRMRAMEQRYNGAGRATHQRTPMGWTFMALAGCAGQVGAARALGHVVRSLSLEDPTNRDMNQAAASAEQLYGRLDEKITASADARLSQNMAAARNKVNRFMACEHIFSQKRARLGWGDVLARPSDWHIVLCDVTSADGRTYGLPDGMQSILGKWLMYRLWHTVTSVCQGWQTQGKHTMFVCDEMSLLANADDTILSAMKDQGRSFGWIPVVATQYPEQLPPRLLTSVFGYSTFITFDNTDATMAARTAQQLTSRDGEDGWTAAAVQGLSRYHIALRTRDDEQLQPACIVKVTDFDRDYRD